MVNSLKIEKLYSVETIRPVYSVDDGAFVLTGQSANRIRVLNRLTMVWEVSPARAKELVLKSGASWSNQCDFVQ